MCLWGPLFLNYKPSSSNQCSHLVSDLATIKEIEEVIPDDDNCPDDATEGSSPSKKRGRKPRLETPIVDSAVRRSNRIRTAMNGFNMSSCKVKNYLGCSSDIPTLSSQALKKIGTSLCDLQEEQLDEQVLMSKKKVEPVGKKIKKSKKGKDDKEVNHDGNKDDHQLQDESSLTIFLLFSQLLVVLAWSYWNKAQSLKFACYLQLEVVDLLSVYVFSYDLWFLWLVWCCSLVFLVLLLALVFSLVARLGLGLWQQVGPTTCLASNSFG